MSCKRIKIIGGAVSAVWTDRVIPKDSAQDGVGQVGAQKLGGDQIAEGEVHVGTPRSAVSGRRHIGDRATVILLLAVADGLGDHALIAADGLGDHALITTHGLGDRAVVANTLVDRALGARRGGHAHRQALRVRSRACRVSGSREVGEVVIGWIF